MPNFTYTNILLMVFSSISYANLVTVYLLTSFFLPSVSLFLKPLPALNKALNADEAWKITFACYAMGDFLMAFSKGQDLALMLALSFFIGGHVVYLRDDSLFFPNQVLMLIYSLLATTGMESGTRALMVTYFPILWRCLTYSQEQGVTRKVAGWTLFFLSDVLIAHNAMTGATYSQVPLILYWLGLELL